MLTPPVGNTVINGTDQNDSLPLNPDPFAVVDETINGFGGMDTLSGFGGNDWLDGGADDDVLFGGAGNDTLLGGGGNDALLGEAGDDWLQGGAGIDILIGGTGSDTFSFSFAGTTTGGESESFTDWLIGHGFGSLVKNGEFKDGTHELVFDVAYLLWLHHLVKKYDIGSDLNGDGHVGVRLNHSDPAGTPLIEGLSADQLDALFSDRDNVTLKVGLFGRKTHEHWYSNTFSTGGDDLALSSADSHDIIADFEWNTDKLHLGGIQALSFDEFCRLFDVQEVRNVGGQDLGALHSNLSLADGSWSVTLIGYNALTEADFFSQLSFG